MDDRMRESTQRMNNQSLSQKEERLIELTRSLEYGEVTAVVKDGKIAYIRRMDTIKL